MNRKERRKHGKGIEWKVIKDPNHDDTILQVPNQISPEKVREIVAKLKTGMWVLK